MSGNQDKLDQCLSKATLDFETFASELTAGRNNGLIDDDTGQLLSSLSECIGAKLEVLKLLADELETVRIDA
jgi:hypothetical protein